MARQTMTMRMPGLLKHGYGRIIPVAVPVLLVGAIGSTLMLSSHASTPTASVESESGTVSSCGSSVADSSASGGHAVKFGGCKVTSTSPDDPTNLDASGATIPDTNYAIPSGAIFMSTAGSDSNAGTKVAPVKTLNKAISLVAAGGTIVVRGGTDSSPSIYRDWYSSGSSYGSVSKSITIQAYPHEKAWFDGTDVKAASAWTSDGAGHWYMTWSTPSFCSNAYYIYAYNTQSGSTANPGANSGPCTHYDNIGSGIHAAAADPQMVFKNGAYVNEVASLSSITSSSFYYQEDLAGKTGKLYIGFNPTGTTVEVAARPIALNMSGANTNVLGLGFKRFATNEYDNTTKSALRLGGANSLAENDVFTQNAGGALYVGSTGGVVNHDVLANNGFTALGSNGHQHSDGSADGLVMENNVVSQNNNEYFGTSCSVSCANAGIKLGHMDGFTLKNNILENNYDAEGFWCDLACSHGVMVDNIAHGNGKSGIMYEVSDSGIIASNLVYDNAGYGIRTASANTKIYNNTLVDNTGYGGMWIYDDSRSYGYAGWTDVGPDTTNIQVGNNIVADTKNSNTLLRAQGQSTTQTNTPPSKFFSYFDYNSYWRSVGASQNLMRWLPPTAEVDYKSVIAFHAALGFDAHGTDTTTSDPFFTDMAASNYTLRSNSTAYRSGGTIPTDVAAALGVSTAAGQSRGAFVWPGKQ